MQNVKARDVGLAVSAIGIAFAILAFFDARMDDKIKPVKSDLTAIKRALRIEQTPQEAIDGLLSPHGSIAARNASASRPAGVAP